MVIGLLLCLSVRDLRGKRLLSADGACGRRGERGTEDGGRGQGIGDGIRGTGDGDGGRGERGTGAGRKGDGGRRCHWRGLLSVLSPSILKQRASMTRASSYLLYDEPRIIFIVLFFFYHMCICNRSF